MKWRRTDNTYEMLSEKIERQAVNLQAFTKSVKRVSRIGLVFFIISNSLLICGQAKIYYWSLYELVRDANLILMGQVSQLRKESAVITVSSVLKGEYPNKQIEVSPIFFQGCVGDYPNFDQNEEVVLFLKPENKMNTVLYGGQGKISFKGKSKKEYREALVELVRIFSKADNQEQSLGMIHAAKLNNRYLRETVGWYVDKEIADAKNREDYKDLLRDLLLDQRDDVKIVGLWGLRHISAPELIPLFVKATHSKSPRVIDAASRNLTNYNTPEALQALIALTNHPDAEIRIRAIVDLRQNKNNPEVRQALQLLENDPDKKVRDFLGQELN